MSKGEKTRMNVTLSSCFLLRGLQTTVLSDLQSESDYSLDFKSS